MDGEHLQREDTGQREDSHPEREGANGVRFHHAAQNNVQCKTYEWLISGSFYLIFLDHGLPHKFLR